MPITAEQLATDAISLCETDRARLANLLLASLSDQADSEIDSV